MFAFDVRCLRGRHREQAKRRPVVNVVAPTAPSQLHQMVGYFAIIGMSRLQCLLGDYYDCESDTRPWLC